LLMLFISVTIFIALIPALAQILGTAQGSDSLNCHGYVNYDDSSLSANDSRAEVSSIGCIAIKLYLPYIALGVLLAAVGLIIGGRMGGGQEPTYG